MSNSIQEHTMQLSIITINYNNAEGLRKTLASVAAQTYLNIEHIIIDGNSTDGSVDVIEAYASGVACTASGCGIKDAVSAADAAVNPQPAKGAQLREATQPANCTLPAHSAHHQILWVSEKDKGIYNAMNKGIEIALGKRVVNDDHTSLPILNPSLKGRTLNTTELSPFPSGEGRGEACSFAQVWGAHTADSTQYGFLKENAKANRKNPTEAESVMWDMLKGNNLGYHFRRQHIILDYIVDFICLEKGLVIELDGGYHNDPEQKEYDERRTVHLQRLGYTELRFKNEELLCAPDSVIQKITETLEQLPSLQGGAGGRLALYSDIKFRRHIGCA